MLAGLFILEALRENLFLCLSSFWRQTAFLGSSILCHSIFLFCCHISFCGQISFYLLIEHLLLHLGPTWIIQDNFSISSTLTYICKASFSILIFTRSENLDVDTGYGHFGEQAWFSRTQLFYRVYFNLFFQGIRDQEILKELLKAIVNR